LKRFDAVNVGVAGFVIRKAVSQMTLRAKVDVQPVWTGLTLGSLSDVAEGGNEGEEVG